MQHRTIGEASGFVVELFFDSEPADKTDGSGSVYPSVKRLSFNSQIPGMLSLVDHESNHYGEIYLKT